MCVCMCVMPGSPLSSLRDTETERVRSKSTIAAVLLVTKRCMRKIKACTFYGKLLFSPTLPCVYSHPYISDHVFTAAFRSGERIEM